MPTSLKSKAKRRAPKQKPAAKKLLSGGNPQVAKGEGNAPVRAYLEAIPGWKQKVAKRIDAVVKKNVPKVQKAMKWNSPFYGVEGRGWFLSLHVFTNYVKVTFFKGTSLKPKPPGASKHPEVAYLDVREDDLDPVQLGTWVKQAAKLPGWMA